MYINTFKYTPKDVSCQLCTEYVKKLGCTALRCPWLAERIEAGVVGYREAVLETFPHERRLFQRLNLLINPYSITVKTGYNPASLQADGIKVYTIKKELHDVGIVTMNTPFGNPVPVYDMERTICDLIRSRSGIEMQTFQDALKQYAKRKGKDLRKLMRYAQMFRVEKLLRQYLEVLL